MIEIKKIAIFLLILLLGCTETVKVRGMPSEGLKISRFEPDIQEVQETGRVVLALLVQNTGLFPAEDVSANLFMHDGFETTGWDKTKVDLPALGQLKPADTELNTPGGTVEALWDMKAPKISKGESTYPFNFLLDLSYGYTSTGFRTIPILEYDRVLQLKQANKPLPQGEAQYQNGPLGITINVDDPIILKTGDRTFIVKVILTLNDGYLKEKTDVSGGDCGTEELNCIRSVEIEYPDWLEIITGNDPEGDRYCAFDKIDSTHGKKEQIKLVEGKEVVLSCKMKLADTKTGEEFNPTIKVTTTYRHHVRGESLVTVKK